MPNTPLVSYGLLVVVNCERSEVGSSTRRTGEDLHDIIISTVYMYTCYSGPQHTLRLTIRLPVGTQSDQVATPGSQGNGLSYESAVLTCSFQVP